MIRFAGVDLITEDLAGDVSAWLDRHFALADVKLFGARPMATMSPTIGPRSVCCLSLGLPVVNYPPPPPLRINSLYWPTGATRWARGLFLATQEQLDEILIAVKGDEETGYDPKQLVIADSGFSGSINENGWSHDESGRVALSTELYLLTPRPVTCARTAQKLWFVPLVDARYWWQQKAVETFNPQSWVEALDALEAALGIETGELIYSDISSDWGLPDPTEFHRDYQNAAVLLDAAARSLGRRVVQKVSGVTELIDWDGSETRLAQNVAVPARSGAGVPNPQTNPGFIHYQELAGGTFVDDFFQSAVPETIRLVFREVDSGTLHAIDKAAEDYDQATWTPNATRTIFCAARDDFTSGGGGDEATDATKALADRIATAEFAFSAVQYDRSFAGIKAWWHTGYCDAVEWTFGARMPDGAFEASTRVNALPPDVGVDVNLCQSHSTIEEDCDCAGIETTVWEGWLTEDLDPSTSNGELATTALMQVASAAGYPWGDVPSINERQTLRVLGTPTGGTFTLTYAGQTTSGIAHDADAATVQAALVALSNIGTGNVTCTGGDLPGTAVVIEFTGDLAATDVETIAADGASLTGGTSPRASVRVTREGQGSVIVTNRDDRLTGRGPTAPGEKGDYCIAHLMPNGERRIVWISCRPANEKQRIELTGTPTGGTFTLQIWGLTTGSIAYNASAATVKTALEAILGTGNVDCTGGSLPGTAVLVEFTGIYGETNVPLMKATSSLTGGTSPAVTISVDTSGCCN